MSASDKLDLEPLFAETRARLAAIRARKKAAAEEAEEAAKPKVIAAVSPKMAEAIKANPGSFRVSAKGDDDTTVVDRPRRTEVIQVIDEPTVDGRLTRAWRTDCVTGERSVIEFVGGYRQPAGAVSNYNPLDGLRTRDDE